MKAESASQKKLTLLVIVMMAAFMIPILVMVLFQ